MARPGGGARSVRSFRRLADRSKRYVEPFASENAGREDRQDRTVPIRSVPRFSGLVKAPSLCVLTYLVLYGADCFGAIQQWVH